MNLFFGKISKKVDLNQIEKGYYQAPKDSGWFGDIEIGDYAYIIGGDKIQFWRAKEWTTFDGNERLNFEILSNDLRISVNDLTALNFLAVNKALLVLTSRSARNRAFFKLNILHNYSIDQLSNFEFYKDISIYRKIVFVDSTGNNESLDIQLKYHENKLTLIPADFHSDITELFRDNLKFVNQGSKLKDKTLVQILKAVKSNETLSKNEISFRSFYDAFFCDYVDSISYYVVGAYWDTHNPQDLTDLFVAENRWQNGYNDKFIDKVNSIPEGSHIAIKAAYVKNKATSAMKIKARGVVVENQSNGQDLKVEWEANFSPFEVEFGGYRQTVKEVTNKDHIELIWNNKVMNNFRKKEIALLYYKKQIILQGPPGTGKTKEAKEIAEELISENYINSRTIPVKHLTRDFIKNTLKVNQKLKSKNEKEFEIVSLDKNVVVLKSETSQPWRPSYNKIIDSFSKQLWLIKGRTGGFKSYEDAIAKYLYENHLDDIESSEEKVEKIEDFSLLIQFHPSYTYEDFVRGIVTKPNSEGEGIIYEAENKTLGEFAEKASNDPENKYVLIIDEINRANLSSVLGELIYALEYRGESVESMYHVDGSNKLNLPTNLYIIGTMNTADRSVGHIDYAIRRRFAFIDVLPKDLSKDGLSEFDEQLFRKISQLFISNYDGYYNSSELPKRAKTVSTEFRVEDVWLGHSYFISKENGGDIKTRLEYEIKPILIEYVKDGILIGKITIGGVEISVEDYIKSL